MTKPKPPAQPVPVLLLTVEQAAEACQVSRDKFDQWTHRAGFPVIRDNGTVRIPLDLLKQWLEAEAQATNKRPMTSAEAMIGPLIPPAWRRG